MDDLTPGTGAPGGRRMPGLRFRVIREWLGLDVRWLAAHLSVNPRTLRVWEEGEHPVPDWVPPEVERLRARTAEAVDRLVGALGDRRDPVVRTYGTDEQYREYEPDRTWPASWHRRVVARAAQEVPGLVIVAPEEGDAGGTSP